MTVCRVTLCTPPKKKRGFNFSTSSHYETIHPSCLRTRRSLENFLMNHFWRLFLLSSLKCEWYYLNKIFRFNINEIWWRLNFESINIIHRCILFLKMISRRYQVKENFDRKFDKVTSVVESIFIKQLIECHVMQHP